MNHHDLHPNLTVLAEQYLALIPYVSNETFTTDFLVSAMAESTAVDAAGRTWSVDVARSTADHVAFVVTVDGRSEPADPTAFTTAGQNVVPPSEPTVERFEQPAQQIHQGADALANDMALPQDDDIDNGELRYVWWTGRGTAIAGVIAAIITIVIAVKIFGSGPTAIDVVPDTTPTTTISVTSDTTPPQPTTTIPTRPGTADLPEFGEDFSE